MSTGRSLPAGSLVIEQYEILERVGGGAMAQVYRVRDVNTGAIHALKALRNPSPEDSVSANNFVHTARREARFLNTLSHPSLPRYEDLFSDTHYVYLLMEFIEGENLKHCLEQDEYRTLDVRMIVNWGIQICDTLAYLHRHHPPIIFRDLKPSNLILRPDDRICLVDFGIARYARNQNATDTIVLGSPGYAPPEQYGQGQTEPRSDIYALGATLHHLLTGRDPSIAPFKWPSVHTLNPMTPRPLDNLIMKCVMLDVEKRPESAEKVGASLREILEMLDEAHSPALAIVTAVRPDNPTGKLTRNDAPTKQLVTLGEEETRTPLELVSGNAAGSESGGLQRAASGSLRPPGRVQFTQAYFTPETRLPAWKDKALLRRWLLIGALIGLTGSLTLPLMSGVFEPPAPDVNAPPPLTVNATSAQQETYRQEEARIEQETHETRQARDAYRNLTPLRFALTLAACVGLLFGAALSERPGRQQLLAYLAGTLCLFALTTLTLLPGSLGLFIVFAVAEGLLTAPALMLLAEGPSRRDP